MSTATARSGSRQLGAGTGRRRSRRIGADRASRLNYAFLTIVVLLSLFPFVFILGRGASLSRSARRHMAEDEQKARMSR